MLIEDFGAKVPHYDMYGHQDSREPFKDKAKFVEVPSRPEWEAVPRYSTKSELEAARRAERVADPSFKIDGDGGVSAKEYFLGKTFDLDGDGRLNTAEKAHQKQAIANNYLDRFSFGHDRTGSKRDYPIMQQRGKIINVDNAALVLPDTYPPHWNHDVKPKHPTRNEMLKHRKANMQNSLIKVQQEYEKNNPVMVPEPPVQQEFMLEEPAHTHIRQRRDELVRESRVRGGLNADCALVNPTREVMSTSLAYVEEPEIRTQTELKERRRKKMQEELEEERLKGEQNFTPYAIQKTAKEVANFDFRRTTTDNMTLTKLQKQRKQDKIEHDMTHFAPKVEVPPQYSAQEKAWWVLQNGYNEDPPQRMPEKEPTCKVTETVVDIVPMSSVQEDPVAPQVVEVAMADGLAIKTITRWSEQALPHQPHVAVRQGRFFDAVNHAKTLCTDQIPLDTFSSFETVRKQGVIDDAKKQAKNTQVDEERIASYRASHRRLREESMDKVDMNPGRASETMSSRASSRAALGIGPTKGKGPPSKVPLGNLQAVGEDLPMTERIARAQPISKAPITPRPAPEKASDTDLKGGGSTKAVKAASAGSTTVADAKVAVRTGGFQWVERQVQKDVKSTTDDAHLTFNHQSSKASLVPPTPKSARASFG